MDDCKLICEIKNNFELNIFCYFIKYILIVSSITSISFGIFYSYCNVLIMEKHFDIEYTSVVFTLISIIIPAFILAVQTSYSFLSKFIRNSDIDESKKLEFKKKIFVNSSAFLLCEVIIFIILIIGTFVSVYFDVGFAFKLLIELSLISYGICVLLNSLINIMFMF